MEFPDLGKHCSEKTCNQLDFLPLKCDACKQDFCKDHFTYTAHKCPYAFKKDVQVPVCPLCNNPIPIKKGEIPDVVVGEHIDRDCKSHPGRREKEKTCLWPPCLLVIGLLTCKSLTPHRALFSLKCCDCFCSGRFIRLRKSLFCRFYSFSGGVRASVCV
uniref:Zinc finger AN1-type containing 2A n=1 Tax=Equus caballus TaxID=9796 RepID=F6Y2C2_HORSE